jgi:aminoglycoside phosphotransferase
MITGQTTRRLDPERESTSVLYSMTVPESSGTAWARTAEHLVEVMPHSYTNLTTRDDSVVTKSYQGPDARVRCAREAAVLSAVAGHLPVAPVLGSSDTSLSLRFMPGVPGQELIEAALAEPVLRACGQMLRRVHAIDPEQAHVGDNRERSAVLVHGDYGPQNILLDAATREVTAVLDWEWAHAGDPVEDLAWCEWIIRMHHGAHVGALGSFFGAYGQRPAWAARQQAMVAQCRNLLALSQRREPSGTSVHLWAQRLRATESWAE